MTASVLTPAQGDELAERGVVALRGLAPAEISRAASDAVTRALRTAGLWSPGQPGATWPKGGVNAKRLGVRPPEVDAVFGTSAMTNLASELLGGEGPDRTVWKRPQLLVTLPNADPRPPPRGWHLDFPRLSRPGRLGAQLFVLLDRVAPGGGGTWVVAGSHRVLESARDLPIHAAHSRLRRWDVFRALYAGVSDPYAYRAAVEGIDLRLVEMSGEAGDVFVMDPRVLHSGAPNGSDRPRIMATDRFVTADVAAEMMGVA